jgi:hypothetical protein
MKERKQRNPIKDNNLLANTSTRPASKVEKGKKEEPLK